MPIVDSKTGKVLKKLNSQELTELANEMRGFCLTAIHAAGSGHPGGSLSVMDVAAALYFNIAKHDPKKPEWADRDRIIWSAGHKAPALYTCLGYSGYFKKEHVMTLRKLGSPFQGHPHYEAVSGVEASTGSLGHGLSIAVGCALAAKLDKRDSKVFCILGDGEMQEGQIWEAIMEAAKYKLDNLIAIVDKNNLQIDGRVNDIMNVFPLYNKLKAFGWRAMTVPGHNMERILFALNWAIEKGDMPAMIIAETVKGKGVSFMEDKAEWHGKAPNKEELMQALKELNLLKKIPYAKLLKIPEEHQKKVLNELERSLPKFKKDYWWNSQRIMKADMKASRNGFGEAVEEAGEDERVVGLTCDLAGSVKINMLCKNNPERSSRLFNMGIAEQSTTGVAAGLAKEGKLALFSTFGIFATSRNHEQIRTSICYNKTNVMIAGSHCGITVGADGATHQALEDISTTAVIPNMNVCAPCDAVETKKAVMQLLFKVNGPKYIRFGREDTAVVTADSTPFVFGKANIIRFRKERKMFADAFETEISTRYKDEHENISIIACGIMVPEAMRAAWILKSEYGIEARIINMHTVKPLDKAAVARAARETGAVLTAEEHQKGGFGNMIAAVAAEEGIRCFSAIGVNDVFGESGSGWELMKKYGLCAEHIAAKAKAMVQTKAMLKTMAMAEMKNKIKRNPYEKYAEAMKERKKENAKDITKYIIKAKADIIKAKPEKTAHTHKTKKQKSIKKAKK